MQTFPKPLSASQEALLLSQYRQGNHEAREQLIEHNLRLVAHIIKKYAGSGKDPDELLSVGMIGLVKAVNTYNFDKGNRLATYAARCIDNELLMLMRNEKKLLREISLYDPIGSDKEGNEISLLNIIEKEMPEPFDQFETKELIHKLSTILPNVLTTREYYIILRRYGLYGHPEMTQRILAKDLGISRSYISRIEKKALLKLRHALIN